MVADRTVLTGCTVLLVAAAVRAGGPTSQPVIRLGHDTTRITSPLKADGTPDYVAAINREHAKGVTRENNAAIPLIQALGPQDIDPQARAAILKALDLKLPADGTYHVPWFVFEETANDSETHERLWQNPWKTADHPAFGRWLNRNEASLATVVRASRRSRYFVPLLPPSPGECFISDPALQGSYDIRCRPVAKDLLVRASRDMGEGRLEDAWGDMSAVYRLGSLVKQRPFMINRLIGEATEGLASGAGRTLLRQPGLSAALARRMLADLSALPRARPLADLTDREERYLGLEFLIALARNRKVARQVYMPGGTAQPIEGIYGKERIAWTSFVLDVLESPEKMAGVDWSEVLRLNNRGLDEAVADLRRPIFTARAAANERFRQEQAARVEKAQRLWKRSAASAPAASAVPTVDAEWVVTALSTIGPEVFGGNSVYFHCQTIVDKGWMERQLCLLGAALVAYGAEKGKYPDGLSELAPAYVKEVPKDVFSGKPLIYRRDAEGVLLYSVGEDMTDDGGKDLRDGGKDISVRLPPGGQRP